MKKRINLEMIGIAALAILLTLGLSTLVFYESFQHEVMSELKTYAHILERMDLETQKEQEVYDSDADQLRITLIEKAGEVVYDSNMDIAAMDNHGSRPEVERAFQSGYGKAIRRSDTINKTAFYYALRLEDGSVLRVAKEAKSIFSVFGTIAPVLGGIMVLLFLLCLLLAHFLTKSMVRPIEQISENMEDLSSIETYQELMPFIYMIQAQHDDIVKNARLRQDFTANVSHELKTPLTSISGYSELIENGMATQQDIIRFAGEIRKNANRLLTLINDIIRLSQLDIVDENSDVAYESVDLYMLAQNCVDMLQMNAGKHKVKLTLEGMPSRIQANKDMMEELLYNLCDNGIRYNRENGAVLVTVKPWGDKIFLSVKDTGIGIPKEHQSRIFERFYRVDKSRSKATGGTGLGLAIVKHIVAAHHAKMELKSEIGKGTEILIWFSL